MVTRKSAGTNIKPYKGRYRVTIRKQIPVAIIPILLLLLSVSVPSQGASFCRHRHLCSFFGGSLLDSDIKPCLLNAKNPASFDDTNTPLVQGLVKNLFSVCVHIQDPALYSTQQTDCSILRDDNGTCKLVTSCSVQEGEILSLYPIHALGIRKPRINTQEPDKETTTSTSVSRGKQIHHDFIVFDQNKDGAFFESAISNTELVFQRLQDALMIDFQIDILKEDKTLHLELFVDINPTRETHTSGWLGHLSRRDSKHEDDAANCVVLPLPGAAPICALVATKAVDAGTELVSFSPQQVSFDDPSFQHVAALVTKKYFRQIEELRAYLAMAYQPPLRPTAFAETWIPQKESCEEKVKFEFPFHTINLDYPGVRYLHREPDIIAIDKFLSNKECDRIIDKAGSSLIPCVIKHPATGEVMEDRSRTSTNANIPQSDAVSVVDKLVRLLNCQDSSYLETLQMLKYSRGQRFEPHTDGFSGPTSACGFHESGRMATVFCYLNDVHEGGGTRFTKLSNLTIKPSKGMAVVHFPTTTGFEEDLRTEHEGAVALDDKWLLVTWLWKHPRTDPDYDKRILSNTIGTRKKSDR